MDEEQTFSVEATTSFIDRFENDINELCVFSRRFDYYPFDAIAGEMIAKSFALSRSAILLIQGGYQDEALGLCRSLYESAMYLRYITEERNALFERSIAFLKFGVTSKAFWLYLAGQSSSITQQERGGLERYRIENRIPVADENAAARPWSGKKGLIKTVSERPHPLDAVDSTVHKRKAERALAYTDTSSYVHCTQPGLNAYAYAVREPIIIRKSHNMFRIDTAQRACVIIQVQLNEVVRYCFYGMNVFSREEFRR